MKKTAQKSKKKMSVQAPIQLIQKDPQQILQDKFNVGNRQQIQQNATRLSLQVTNNNQGILTQPNQVNKSGNFSDDEPVTKEKFNTEKDKNSHSIAEYQERLKLLVRSQFKALPIPSTESILLPALISVQAGEFEEPPQKQQQQQQQQQENDEKEPVKQIKEESKVDQTTADTSSISSRAPIDLICIIDRSGSMHGEKIQLVKDTLLSLLELLEDKDRLCLINFDDKVERMTKLMRVSNQNKPQFQKSIQQLGARGCTDIALGIDMGLKVLKGRKERNPVTSMFLLSDGLDGGAEKKVEKLLSKCQESFTINTFGFGNDHDSKMMSDISRFKDGSFFFIEKLDQVDEAFVSALGGLLSVLLQDVQIQVKLLNPVFKMNISKVYGDMWQVVEKGISYKINLAQFIQGTSKEYVFEIDIPKCDEIQLNDNQRNQIILEVKIQGQTPEQDKKLITQQTTYSLQFFNKEENIEMDEDGELMENYFRVKAAEAIQESMNQVQTGNYKESEDLLQNVIVQINQSKKVSQKKVQTLVKDLETAKEMCKPQVYATKGKHAMLNMQRAHMEQKAMMLNEDADEDNMAYCNKKQKSMISQAKSKKMKW